MSSEPLLTAGQLKDWARFVNYTKGNGLLNSSWDQDTILAVDARLRYLEAALARATAEAAVLREAIGPIKNLLWNIEQEYGIRGHHYPRRLHKTIDDALSATPLAAATARVVEAAIARITEAIELSELNADLESAVLALLAARESAAKGERE